MAAENVVISTVTTAAVASAGTTDYPGEPWTVPKFYWTVFSRSAFITARSAVTPDDLLPDWVLPRPEDITFGYSDEDVDAVVDAGEAGRVAKAAALAEHATQVVVGPTGRACALSNNLALPILAQEHYVLAAGSAGERDERGWETDLLGGLGFTGTDTL